MLLTLHYNIMKKKVTKIFLFAILFIIVFAGINNSAKTLKSKISDYINNSKTSLENTSSLTAGSPYLINFSLGGISDKQIWSIEQDSNGVMIFANRKGLITFDGLNWKYVKTPSVPYKIKKEPTTNTIFVGCNNGIGYLSNSDGTYKFEPINFKESNIGEISEIIYNDQNIYFYNESYVARVNILNYNDNSIVPCGTLDFSGIFCLNNKIYVSVTDRGFYEVDKEFLRPVPFTANKLSSEILFTIPIQHNKVIFGTDDNKLLTFDGTAIEEFVTDAQSYFTENYIINSILIDSTQFAIGTIGGGTVVINYPSGKSTEIINSFSGLPDNEVYSMCTDNNGGLWISHIFGVSRVDFNVPLKNFGNYYGLKGNIISTCMVDSVLYVITSEGVFYLTQPKDLNELNSIQQKQKEEKVEEVTAAIQDVMPQEEIDATIDNNTNNTETNTENIDENKSFLKKWIDKKKNKKKDNDDVIIEDNTNINTNPEIETPVIDENNNNVDTTANISNTDNNITEVVDETNNNMQKVDVISNQPTESKTFDFLKFNYFFKKIDGIDEKCKQIENYNNTLLVATNSGVYQIKENIAELIFKEKYANNLVKSSNPNSYYVTSLTGIDLITYENYKWTVKKIVTYDIFNETIYSIVEDDENNLWLGAEDVVYHVILDRDKNVTDTKKVNFNTDFSDKIIVKYIYGKIYYFLSDGIYFYDEDNQKIEKETSFTDDEVNYLKYISSQDEIIWYYKNYTWFFQDNSFSLNYNQTIYLNLFDNIRDIKLDKYNNLWVVDGFKSIYKINKVDTAQLINSNFSIFTNKVYTDSLVMNIEKSISINYNNNGLFIDVSAPFYLKEKSTQYQYFVEGLMHDWSEWTTDQKISLYLKSGKYTLHVKARNILGTTTSEEIVKIVVKPPFWETGAFYFFVGIFILAIILFIFRIRQRNLFKRTQELEQKVKERTHEITMQKEELQSQKDEIETQRDEIKLQRDIVTSHRDLIVHQTKQITDSIEYARRIQNAILPLKDALGIFFSEFFIINMPRDVVSGDFYFFKQSGNKVIVAVADCTGHGVPGAFLSMMGVAYLNEIVSKTENFYANEILNTLRNNVIESLHQSAENDRKDGMDMALCIFDNSTNEVQFAGAYNPLFISRDNDIIEIPADKMPIGFHQKKHVAFSSRIMTYQKNDIFYLFSDGFMDQFGGKSGRKFLKGNFKKLLLDVSDMPLDDQKDLIMTAFNDWKGEKNQIDDILVMAVKI